MKRRLYFKIGFLMILLLGAWVYCAKPGISSKTFAGPEFHSLNSPDCSTIFADFARHLEQIGFEKSMAPSVLDSQAGFHAEGGQRTWYVKSESTGRRTVVNLDLEEWVVRTQIKWEIIGTSWRAQAAERDAYKLAVDLDDWFAARKEANQLAQKIKDEKRRQFERSSAKES